MAFDAGAPGSRGGRAAVALAALLWATTGVAGKLAPEGTSAAVLAEVRALVGGLTLAGFVLLRSGWAPFRLVAGWPLIVASAALGIFQWSFFAAVHGAGSAVAAVVSAGVSPFAADMLESARAPGRPRVLGAVGLLLAVAACALALSPHVDPMLSGLSAAIVSGVAYAVYAATASQRARHAPSPSATPHGDTGVALTALALLGAAVALAPIAFADLGTLASIHGAVTVAYLGVIATALPYAAFIFGLRRLSTGDALAVLVLQPLGAAAIGWFVLRERLDGPAAFATVVLLVVTIIRSFRPSAGSRSIQPVPTEEKVS